jgi:hypothetical protein
VNKDRVGFTESICKTGLTFAMAKKRRKLRRRKIEQMIDEATVDSYEDSE